jgi:hypothetical protein
MGPFSTLFHELFQGCSRQGTLPNSYSDWGLCFPLNINKKSEIFKFSPCYWCLFLMQLLLLLVVVVVVLKIQVF